MKLQLRNILDTYTKNPPSAVLSPIPKDHPYSLDIVLHMRKKAFPCPCMSVGKIHQIEQLTTCITEALPRTHPIWEL